MERWPGTVTAPVSSTATSLRKSSKLPPANDDQTMLPPPVEGNRNWVTKPDFTSGKSGVAGGFGVITGFTLPAVVGTLVPEIRLTS